MDLTGAKATGEVEADTKQVVADQLKARGLIVLDIKAKHASKEISLDFMKRVKPTDLTILTRQLATMISSGMTILRALYTLEAQTENKLLADIIADVRKDVEAGPPAQRRARAPPQGLLAALRGHDARRRDRRRARGVAAARRRPAREGGLAAPADQVAPWSTRGSS